MSMRCSGTENEAEEIHVLVKQCLELAGKLTVGDALGPLKMGKGLYMGVGTV